ncbi:PrcB C-terminal [Melghirimyces thermohalophilus]|uniref:PrcB C-terminal n=2 Tax=Melghirimyces thermohalophilus TaxID=1236220 RepID=A0A1G6Q9M6_9BACL|nr:PrcB C-terminal [Melghirimyces thermohalophilus]
MFMGGEQQKKGFSYRVLSVKEQKKMPGSVRKWINKVRTEKGVYTRRHRGGCYLVIAAGMKPNPGYRLEVSKLSKEEDGRPAMWVRETIPESGQMQPQVISYPCLVIRVKGGLPHVFRAESGNPIQYRDSDI